MTDGIINALYALIQLIENIGFERLTLGLESFNPAMHQTAVITAEMVVQPVAIGLLTLWALLELVEIGKKTDGNDDITWQLMLPFMVRFSVAYVFVTQAANVLTLIFNIALGLITGMAMNISTHAESIDLSAARSYVSNMGVGSQLTLWIPILIVLLIAHFTSIFVDIKITMRMIEIYVLMAFSPIPLSTFSYGHTTQMGVSFLKNFAAVCIQGGIMLFYVFLASSTWAGLGNVELLDEVGITTMIWGIAGYMLLLVFATMASEATSKKAIGVL